MRVEFEIPDDVAAALAADGRDTSRMALEALAIDGYRTGRLSEWQIVKLLGFEIRIQVHEFLKDHDVYLNYSEADLLHDIEAARRQSDDVPQRRAG